MNKEYSQSLWMSQDLLRALGLDCRTVFTPSVPITGISIDTRTLMPGDLFIAFRGRYRDGHALLDQAFARGASGAIVDQPTKDPRVLYVDDTRKALWCLGHAARKRYQGSVFAVTGSTGKTTIKEGLRHVLCQQSACFASKGSFNNDLGVSVSLSSIPVHVDYGLFELGMNRSGEILDLVRKVQPKVVMVNNVSYQHSENFDHLDAIASAKSEIFSAPSVHTAVLCHDCPYFSFLHKKATACGIRTFVTFGQHPQATVRILSVDTIDQGMARIHACIAGKELLYTVPFLGDQWITNSAGILASIFALGGGVTRASQHLVSFRPPAGRGRQLSIGGITIVDNSYNAAPAAMEKALHSFSSHSFQGKKHILLGEMRELGMQEKEMHKALIPLIHQSCDHAWLCGSAFQPVAQHVDKPCHYAVSVRALIMPLLKKLRAGDALLVKGARGTETFAVIYALYKMYESAESAESYPLLSYLSPDTRAWIDKLV